MTVAPLDTRGRGAEGKEAPELPRCVVREGLGGGRSNRGG